MVFSRDYATSDLHKSHFVIAGLLISSLICRTRRRPPPPHSARLGKYLEAADDKAVQDPREGMETTGFMKGKK
jgi:hypothetical protein